MPVNESTDAAPDQQDEEIKCAPRPGKAGEKRGEATPGPSKGKSKKDASVKTAQPGQPSTMFYLHAAMLLGGRFLTGMLDFYNNLFGLSPKDKLKIYRNVSKHYLRKGMHDKAIESLKEWTRIDRDNPEAHYHLAMALAASGKGKQALIVLNRVLKLDPFHSDALYRRCKLLIKAKEYKEAVTGLETIIANKPDDANILYLLGVAYSQLDEIGKAIEVVKRAIELAPEESKYYQHLGFLHERNGDHQDAARCFSRVMELEEQDDAEEDA